MKPGSSEFCKDEDLTSTCTIKVIIVCNKYFICLYA